MFKSFPKTGRRRNNPPNQVGCVLLHAVGAERLPFRSQDENHTTFSFSELTCDTMKSHHLGAQTERRDLTGRRGIGLTPSPHRTRSQAGSRLIREMAKSLCIRPSRALFFPPKKCTGVAPLLMYYARAYGPEKLGPFAPNMVLPLK
jgi:hypothetical protein